MKANTPKCIEKPRALLSGLVLAAMIAVPTFLAAQDTYEDDTDSDNEIENVESGTHRKVLPAVLTETFVAGGINAAATEIMKSNIHSMRPDGSNSAGMPSRHTSWAFTATTLLSLELSSYTPWAALGSYALGSGVGIQRVMSRSHYPGQVFAGAGVGTFSGTAGYILSNLAFGYGHRYPNIGELYFDNTAALTVESGAVFPLSTRYGEMRLGTGIFTSLQASIPRGDRWSITAKAILQSSPVSEMESRQFVAPLTRLGGTLGANAEFAPFEGPISLGAHADVGYLYTFAPDEFSVGRHSPLFEAGVSIGVPVTEMLVVTAGGSYQVSRIKIASSSRAAQALTLSLATRAYF